ncbi:DNA gyrase subunit A [Clostridium pasteurianum DSM 525 = ATCC 6013]|uniref:DNA gyrase subunit A n=2 Tax=Clostridium pasteurianum TaxID=1501 RepID=A0A0H3J0F9_CLOPA|nr:DNA gyrase subunit A [Clostridium pasteurianum]AJA46147.1 DNA gyrase subunit A [Clostridium pasteurianum DSM 525 = ATCC 6013]AJA50135.1 DNA gyrase subunit A [Clostridium pasteurianum DSM 525 = ATCC 6013]AOZ73609.1 DNA gyrase subunit A [Clostridium pasteurianum DSM 525 = ATCC 6013]AOZ77407.1 DNA gyrase subunit A [Clostridium pasteurianum]ELP59166.1 DNA gyrase subunit A [Clostridium pasteurianum DSM 525 = ATCC 6013]
MNNEGKVLQVNISEEMKKCYISYAMSVIIDRALPDVRDGLKPVHRRIIYSMHELGLTPDKGYRKCARIVGDVLGKYHPHGDASVYDALVRMAQDFNLRYPLVNGHGNFGSVDGDSAAAMRYTEAKMSKMAMEMVRDISKNTVDFGPNFDGEEEEPSVIPSRFPNLLVNGSSGIAVGMATNIPPHNLNEVIDGIFMLIDNSETTILELMTKIKGPDFPTSGMIIGKSGIRSAYETGRGKVIVRSKCEIEEVNNKHRIIVTELPYQVNKAKLIENMAELVKDKRLVGISDLRDESDREGMRIVIELKRDANPQVLLNQLYKHTKLQDSFGIIILALVDGKPQYLNLKQVLQYYIDFQEEVIKRRTQFELDKARARAHILEGLKIALDHIDEVISIIRSSKTVREAEERLMKAFSLSEKQSEAIVEMKLRRLTGLERDKIEEELAELVKNIEYLEKVLANRYMILNIIKDELTEIKSKYGDERKTVIENAENEIDIEDLIEEEDVVITLTHAGYIKRLPADTYTAQRRGGRGIQAMATKEDDFVEHIFITSTHNNILFFSNRGRVYKLKAYEIHEAGRTAKGTNLINLLQLNQDEKIQAVITLKEFKEEDYLIMATKNGVVKKTSLDQYSTIRKSGLNAINLREDDELIGVRLTNGDNDILMTTKNGYAIRFNEKDARPLGRNASGVRGITLRGDDIVVGMEVVDVEKDVLVVSSNGFGKRTPVSEYSVQKRGGKGVITYKVNDKTGELVGARMVKDTDEVMIINSNDIVIRINVSDISTTSRNAMGVTLMRTTDEEKVMAIAKIDTDESDEYKKEVSSDSSNE